MALEIDQSREPLKGQGARVELATGVAGGAGIGGTLGPAGGGLALAGGLGLT